MKSRTVIVDLDDTLIDTSDVFWRARKCFVNLFHYSSLNDKTIIERFEKIDSENLSNYGHSPYRYRKSMLETYRYFKNDNLLNTFPFDIAQIEKCGEKIYKEIPKKIEGADLLLEFLSENFNCILLTRGAEWLQVKKINYYNWKKYFSEIIIVNSKNTETYKMILNKNNLLSDFWVIGDSIKSDINPAISSGMSAILYKYNHPNYIWEQEYDTPPLGAFYISDTLLGVIDIIKKPENYLKVNFI